ncbi:hypothetical protein AXG93_3483s1170 [Marchantia polymorpha subsp. ruderalis]|uniref:Uncharacterized protein n=1 Tax=Marchantia polymorpha subsp. ruderalis TaxID=1480154 RepID=A0A176WDT4_MARPO|nr:hypothetical protein AXG93_3483s1170 [Marchantia polymorpha subsp. ruderalis]
MERTGLGQLRNVRLVVVLLGVFNVAVIVAGGLVAVGASNANCPHNILMASIVMALVALFRVIWIIGMGFAQAVTASTMIAVEDSKASRSPADESCSRRERRRWYRRWLWWSRLGITMTFLQVMSTAYLTLILGRNLSTQSNHVSFCSVDGRNEQRWLVALMVGLPTLGSIIVFAQCCVGSDVLAWRLLYGAHYGAWRAHYRQMFDYGIREVLCCLGRRRYMSVLEEDEVDSVAALLGDLVAYRAVGASHLEVIAGVALLRESAPAEDANENLLPAPDPLIREATVLHPYAVAAYTGPLLDVGRNPFTFPCAWLYRQGVLTPWKRNRMPKLEGDNWWRGHAAAFLRFAQIPPEALRKGRVLQTKRESVYFVVVLHHLRYVVVAVRGTETPEDLLTDGLGRESALMDSDLCGILKNNTVSDRVKQDVQATMPHFGHIGVIEAARELALELDNLPDADDEENAQNGSSTSNDCNKNNNRSTAGGCQASLLTEKKGLLTSLLGPGGECQGYSLRIVGHSLGGAIAALTGLRLANRYPSLHVYTFGVLPCVDLVTAEACSSFTTSIIYNDEFSSRLSVAAIMRLRAAALQALATDANTDSALVTKLTKRLFTSSSSKDTQSGKSEHSQRRRRRVAHALKGGAFLCAHACRCVVQMPRHSSASPSVGMQLASIVQPFDNHHHFDDHRESVQYDEHRESIEEHTLIKKSQVTYQDSSRSFLGAMDNGHRIGFIEAQSPEERNGAKGVSCHLADREAVVLDAGSENYDEDEAEDLVECSGTGRLERDVAVDGSGDARSTMELLDNGMPKHLVGLGPGVDLQEMWPAEMYVPGLVLHLVRNTGNSSWSALRRSFTFARNPDLPKRPKHKAYLKDRKQFRDILVSPAMFLDHMPWKCQYALNDILEQLNAERQRQAVSSPGSSVV